MKFQISKVFDFFIEKWEFETVFEDTDGSFCGALIPLQTSMELFRMEAAWHASEVRRLGTMITIYCIEKEKKVWNDFIEYMTLNNDIRECCL